MNADVYVITGQEVFGNNMFVYCGNNPVNRINPTGKLWLAILVVITVAVACTVGLTGCSFSQSSTKSNIINSNSLLGKSAEELSSMNPNSFNCYGNGIGKQIYTNPSGYKPGDSTEKTFNAVVDDIGADNVRRLESIDSPIESNEFRVAMKCGSTDYHFIRQLSDGTWYNKSGNRVGTYADISDVTGDIWYAIFMNNGVRTYWFGDSVYDDETIYFAVKVWEE